MKKTNQSIQFGVFIDHQRAVVASYDNEGNINLEEIKNDVDFQPRYAGETTNKTREDENTVDRQHKVQDKFHEQFKKFYKVVISKLNNANSILIFGPAQAKHELHKEITNEGRFKDAYIHLEPSENLSHNEIKRLVSDYYANGIKA